MIRPEGARLQPFLIRGLPAVALAVALGIHVAVPDGGQFTSTNTYPTLLKALLAIAVVAWLVALKSPSVADGLGHWSPLLAVAITSVALLDLVTQKLALLPLPYFPGPDRILYMIVLDWALLGESALHSLRLLGVGYLIGTSVGLVTGIAIGWSKRFHYWLLPVLKIIGPIPATAWIPIALVLFPTSFWASIFLISLAVWFPVTVMTFSGIANVHNVYFEVARTLGADERYLILRVAIPAAFPVIFVGLFMGMGASFLTLIVAEMLGVKAGLGWYISWAQGWAEYAKVYASLIVIAAIFSSTITLLFAIRDRVLVWQKGAIRW